MYLLSDIQSALKNRLDSKWRHFGVHLGVDECILDIIAADHNKVSDCMLDLVGKWMTYKSGTGGYSRTWETVVNAVKNAGFEGIAQQLAAERYGITIS